MSIYWFCLSDALSKFIFFNSLIIKYATEIASLTTLQETSQALSYQVNACEEKIARSEADVRVEREWRCDLQEKEQKAKEQINTLQLHIKQLNDEVEAYNQQNCSGQINLSMDKSAAADLRKEVNIFRFQKTEQ